MLEELIDLEDEMERQVEGENGEEQHRMEQERGQAVEKRQQAMERFGQTRKRAGQASKDDGKEQKRRRFVKHNIKYVLCYNKIIEFI